MTEPKPRGFALLSPERRSELASKAGRASIGKGHQWTPDEARAAGRKGGQAAQAKSGARRWTSDEARAANRRFHEPPPAVVGLRCTALHPDGGLCRLRLGHYGPNSPHRNVAGTTWRVP